MGLALPGELIGLIFDSLDIPSLLRCMQVCRLFHSIISGGTSLCYKIELFASYMEDNEHSPTDIVTRFDLLREYNRVWNNMKWPSSGSIAMRDGRCWEFSGGILAQANSVNEIFFVQLPCKLKGIEERRWSAPFDFSIRDFTLDSSQNLVALVGLAGDLPNVPFKIHFRTLSGEPHPRTPVPEITFTLESQHAEFSFLMQICGDHFAILFHEPFNVLSQKFFAVWNWRTGHQKVYICTPNVQSFAFMTEDLILTGIVNARTLEPTLRVLSVAVCTHPIHTLEDMPYVCELHYPELLKGTEYFLIRSEPTPTWKPPTGSGVPFYYSRKDFIFTVSIRHFSDEIRESTVLFVPLSTLLLEVERSHDVPRRSVTWKDWGPSGTRMICREPSETWVCYNYGMKFIHGLQLGSRHTARAYDFNPYAARKYVKSSRDSPIVWNPLVASAPPSGRCEIFEEQVITTLPGRVGNVELAHLGAGGWEAVMIGEDNILMVQPAFEEYGYMAM